MANSLGVSNLVTGTSHADVCVAVAVTAHICGLASSPCLPQPLRLQLFCWGFPPLWEDIARVGGGCLSSGCMSPWAASGVMLG